MFSAEILHHRILAARQQCDKSFPSRLLHISMRAFFFLLLLLEMKKKCFLSLHLLSPPLPPLPPLLPPPQPSAATIPDPIHLFLGVHLDHLQTL